MIAEAPTVTAYRALPPLRPLAPALEALNLASRRPSPFATLEYLETFLAHDEHAGPGRTPLVLVLEDQGRVVGWVALSVHEERVLGRRTRRVSFLATHWRRSDWTPSS